ncbi:MAG: 30S ribosomal protein S12 methylthiotransferase RimO [Acidobacteria bacterium]|nr:30S ribosomal protein S12 methylthiotransferase RimO [Acidobacteriota bacterium]MBI3655960.1 30S ribosomal protein S12 methylthiotransferase RimO [Acidobacteriota bacterium]
MIKIGFVSLGCPKNLVDSEVMLGLLNRQGYAITSQQEEADIIVVNTCGFIEAAKQESVNSILEMAELKKNGKCQRLVVTGCLVERYHSDLLKEIPEVDAVLGTNDIERIVQTCELDPVVKEPTPTFESTAYGYLYTDTTPRLLTTDAFSAYVKIAEGCDHICAFCMIPKMRGRFRSRAIESIGREVEGLAAAGVKEITLVSQDTTAFGLDQGLTDGLTKLLAALARTDGVEWIRFLYNYPNMVTDALIDVVATESRVCKYFDIPLQHASGPVLAAMRRGGNRTQWTKLIERIRRRLPEATLRTSMIVGFPGETEADFQELLDFCRDIEFDRLGVFTYSDEQESHAYSLPGKITKRTKVQRRNRLLKQQSAISLRKNRSLVGRQFPLLVEGPSRESEFLLQGRLASQAPEIDGVVLINDSRGADARAGDFCGVEITEAHPYDLIGRLV